MVSPESAEKLHSIRLQISELLEVHTDSPESETIERILDLLNLM